MTMVDVRPWKPPARREYRPKPMDPGQRVSWERTLPAVRGEDRGIYGRYDVPARVETITGEIWSGGPSANTWWVVPDGIRAAVMIRRAGKRDIHDDGALYEAS